MADSDRDRGGRRRRHRPDRGRRRDRFGEREEDEGPVVMATTPTKPPIILAKPPSERTLEDSPSSSVTVASRQSAVAPQRAAEKPVVMLKSREDSRNLPSTSLPSIPSALLSGEISQPYQVHQRSGYQVLRDGNSTSGRSATLGIDKLHCVKLVDDNWQWCDTGMEMLLEQNDYLVVGVLGLQGTGKSTLLSLLIGNSNKDSQRSFVFPAQGKDVLEVGSHQTCGIDMYVTPQRIIYLDTQPVLSASVMDHLVSHDKKYPTDFTSVENCVQMQSLQLASFLMTVCNVILVAQDWFTDLTLLRFLLTAEMLKPSSPSINSQDTNSSQDGHSDYQPHLIFVQTNAEREDFSIDTFKSYHQTLSSVFKTSKLRFKGSLTLANGSIISGLNKNTIPSDVNIFLLPRVDPTSEDKDEFLGVLQDYRGYPSFETLMKALRGQLYSVQRYPLTHTTLTEKNWFHYAARTWDQVKKSQMMSEYNRLLP